MSIQNLQMRFYNQMLAQCQLEYFFWQKMPISEILDLYAPQKTTNKKKKISKHSSIENNLNSIAGKNFHTGMVIKLGSHE